VKIQWHYTACPRRATC